MPLAEALGEVLRVLVVATIGARAGLAIPPTTGDDRPLLDVDEAARLLGVSRMTVTRLADEGQIPSVTVRRGRVQKVRRIPRAFIQRMLTDANAGCQVDMHVYTEAWLAEHSRAATAGLLGRNVDQGDDS